MHRGRHGCAPRDSAYNLPDISTSKCMFLPITFVWHVALLRVCQFNSMNNVNMIISQYSIEKYKRRGSVPKK